MEELSTPFPRLEHAEAMRRYGSDSGVFAGALEAGGAVLAVRLPGGGDLTRKQFDEWVAFARARGAKGLAWAVVEPDGSLRSPLAKYLRDDESQGLVEVSDAAPGDALFFAAGPRREAQELLGALRVALAQQGGLVPESEWRFVWVTRWPM